jgi:hypothetical protein
MENNLQKELEDSINQGFKALVSDIPVAKLPEEIFSKHFLPYFSGEKTPTQDKPVFAEWISVAGTPMSPVDIIDKNNEVLFRVPPMFDTGMMTQLQGRTMREIFKQYELYNNNLPQVANNFLTKALTAKSEGYDSVSLTKAQEEWNSILQRYDLGEKTKIAEKNANVQIDDDLIYD